MQKLLMDSSRKIFRRLMDYTTVRFQEFSDTMHTVFVYGNIAWKFVKNIGVILMAERSDKSVFVELVNFDFPDD